MWPVEVRYESDLLASQREMSMGPAKTIRIMCPNLKCRSILVVPETARGKNVKCSNCATLFKIPAQAPTPSPAGAARH